MATENNPNSPKQKSKKLTRLGSKSEQPSIPNVVEKVPDWLRMLLGKYGEAEGKLMGLQESLSGFPDDFAGAEPPPFQQPSADAGELSALLEQMAEDGGPDPAGARTATSVEWGDYPPEAPPATDLDTAEAIAQAGQTDIPDWLNDLDAAGGRPPADEVPDWLNETAPMTAQDQTDAPIAADDVPDWLNDAAALPVPDQPDTLTGDQQEMPDWLNETEPAGTTAETEEDYEIPDWLSAPPAEEEPSPEIPASPTAAADTTDDEFDIPDWLASMAPPVAGAAGVAAAAVAL
jgi:hypothetical protein